MHPNRHREEELRHRCTIVCVAPARIGKYSFRQALRIIFESSIAPPYIYLNMLHCRNDFLLPCLYQILFVIDFLFFLADYNLHTIKDFRFIYRRRQFKGNSLSTLLDRLEFLFLGNTRDCVYIYIYNFFHVAFLQLLLSLNSFPSGVYCFGPMASNSVTSSSRQSNSLLVLIFP